MEIGSKKWNQAIGEGLRAFDISIDDEQVLLLGAYARELLCWNQKINLTAITDPFEVAVKHFIDSIIPCIYIKPGNSIIDIGSGGGFPGVPLSILCPSLSVTLIDTSRKKINFLKHISRTLHLENISAYHISAENYPKSEYFQQTFDIVISRALFPLNKFVSVALPLLTQNGAIIAMKGKTEIGEKEIQSAIEVFGKWEKNDLKRRYTHLVKQYYLPYENAERSIYYFALNG